MKEFPSIQTSIDELDAIYLKLSDILKKIPPIGGPDGKKSRQLQSGLILLRDAIDEIWCCTPVGSEWRDKIIKSYGKLDV